MPTYDIEYKVTAKDKRGATIRQQTHSFAVSARNEYEARSFADTELTVYMDYRNARRISIDSLKVETR